MDLPVVEIDVSALITELQRERLLVLSERRSIQECNERLRMRVEELLRAAWVNFQQRFDLVALRKKRLLEQSCRRAVSLASSTFVPAKKIFEYQITVNCSEFFSLLRARPDLVAQWVVIGEALSTDKATFTRILQTIVAGLYGALLLPQDIALMLKLLVCLAKLQLLTTDDPRRLLKNGSCAFSQIYFMFHEGVTSAKLFLIAALQHPILQVIANSDEYLDIDANQSVSRLSPQERFVKFGDETSPDYESKLNEYRYRIEKTLSDFVKSFVSSLRENICCFPVSMVWLVKRIAAMIAESFGPRSKEVEVISMDLIFVLFICPAIVQPEPYGICDSPVSEIARHNLTQVAQILQMLALLKHETPESKLVNLYGMFEPDCISEILAVLLDNGELIGEEVPLENIPGVQRNVAFFTEQELYNLIAFMRTSHNSILDQGSNGHENASLDFCSNHGDNATLPSNDPLVILLNKLPTENDGSLKNGISPNTGSKKTLLNKAKSITRTISNGDYDESPINVIGIPLQEETELIGMLTEQNVLSMNDEIVENLLIDISEPTPDSDNNLILPTGQEKRTRFSHNDEGSIGNTSDNLEVISEAASNHSVASSIELENEDQNDNDNLSDMVSANVSGRGTPNISGRDTPSSQVTENEDNRPLAEVRQPYLQQPQPMISKQIRSDIDDKFCKFEIKKLLEGDETISIISDTWSTDVLASDSETIDAGDRGAVAPEPPVNPLLDISETQSESAWSTDVLASDTERFTEVDNDDIVSVAPSDDTASVAPSERSELDENLNDRRLSTASVSNSQFVNFQSTQNSPSALQEFRRMDIRRESMPTYTASTSSMKTETHNANGSFESSIVYSQTVETNVLRPVSQSCTDSTKREAVIFEKNSKRSVLGDISNNLDSPGPSGVNNEAYLLVKQVEQMDIQLSNTSLNSSSSGSSNSLEQNKGVNTTDGWKNKIWLNGSENNLNIIAAAENGNETAIKKSMRTKPTASTGAIPKSISFDMSAEKGDKDLDDEGKNKRAGFFGKLRMNFRHRRGKSLRGGGDDYLSGGVRFDSTDEEVKFRKQILTAEPEDILAKYRNKPEVVNVTTVKNEKVVELLTDDNVDENVLFNDAKKKLRLVLGNSKRRNFQTKLYRKDTKKEVEAFLQLELAKARDIKQWSNAARITEALRCLRSLDTSNFRRICEHLRDECLGRSVYVKYLLTSKQVLLSSQALVDELCQQVQRESELCMSFLVTLCVRHFLERNEVEMQRFCDEFRTLRLVDEKNDLLARFLGDLFVLLRRDTLWLGASEDQLQMAQVAIEKSVMTEVYQQALFPNGDGDRHRDSLLSKHLKRLSKTITPSHKYLLIGKAYHNECPWLPAQEALKMMAAYRSPVEKLRCVARCAIAIMDLLCLAAQGTTTADDFTPVLVYVIIQVNPQDLLSTIQYVNTFHGNISGEEAYWWTQFCSAVEFTKTMEYNDD